VLISPQIKPALAKRAASNKTSVRMADAKRTAPEARCKAKTAPFEDEYRRRPCYKAASNRNSSGFCLD
jgi:hypothetical protein